MNACGLSGGVSLKNGEPNKSVPFSSGARKEPLFAFNPKTRNAP